MGEAANQVRLRWNLIWFFVVIGIVALTIFGYVGSLAGAEKKQQNADSDDQVEQLVGATKFIHAVFCAALIIETFLLANLASKVARSVIYRPYFQKQCEYATDLSQPEPQPPSRFVQALVGPPPKLPPPASLPDYDYALRQSARQTARRQAARIGVSAGRRGREQFGSGDPEDLEVERIKRLGGLPPSWSPRFVVLTLKADQLIIIDYRSDEMRKSTVLLRGAKPERRSSILSMFSSSASSEEGSSSPRSPGSQSGITGLVQRFISRGSAAGSAPSSPRNSLRMSPVTSKRRSNRLADGETHVEDEKQHTTIDLDSRPGEQQEKEEYHEWYAQAVSTPSLPDEAVHAILAINEPEPPPRAYVAHDASSRQPEAIV